MKTLNEIGLQFGTDKSSEIHDYLKKYEKYLPFERNQELKILEIGVLNGNSLRTWKEYYPNANVYGIDINPDCKQQEESRITIEIGSQIDGEFLSRVANQYGPFDMILDDGSHMNSHVIYSFENLWNHVKNNGIYVVEDACTSYWFDYGGTYKGPNTTIEYFKNIVDEVNYHGQILYHKHNVHARRDDWHYEHYKNSGILNYGMQIESINFLNAIIIINKR